MTDTRNATQRLLLVAAGLIGAMGVMAAASASHDASRNLGAIATIGLAHGPALLALGLATRSRAMNVAAALLVLGTTIFVADLGAREWLGHSLFTGAAPLGGATMIGGWTAIIVAAALWRPR